jgi:hypothetical protein
VNGLHGEYGLRHVTLFHPVVYSGVELIYIEGTPELMGEDFSRLLSASRRASPYPAWRIKANRSCLHQR